MTDKNLEDIVEEPYEISVKIASDYYSAYMTFNRYDKNVPISKEAVLNTLKDKNVTYGIDLDAVDYALQNQDKVNDILIAKGIEHINGQPGEIIFKIKKSTR